MDLFSAAELELLICGGKTLDFAQLQEGAQYQDGYEADGSDAAIKFFWSVLSEFDEREKKLFLKFVTGSDRCPIDGLAVLKLAISRNTGTSDLLICALAISDHHYAQVTEVVACSSHEQTLTAPPRYRRGRAPSLCPHML